MRTMNRSDYEQQAQAAMVMAIAATGADRQRWVRVALAWWHLACHATDPGLSLSSRQQELSAS